MRLEDSEVTLALMDRLTDSDIDRLLLHCNGAGVQEPRIWMRWTPVTKGRARQGPGFGHLNHPEKKIPPQRGTLWGVNGSDYWTRTSDPAVNSRLLYQLS